MAVEDTRPPLPFRDIAVCPAAHEGFGVELHNVPRSALSRVIKEFITRDKVHRNTPWEIYSRVPVAQTELRAPGT